SFVAPVAAWAHADATLDADRIPVRVMEAAAQAYSEKFPSDRVDPEALHQFERAVMLQSIDTHWREHLAALDYLRQGIHLRGYAQKQPKQEYKREAFELFAAMLDSIKREVTRTLMNIRVQTREEVEEAERKAEEAARAVRNIQYQHADYNAATAESAEVDESAPQVAPGATDDSAQPFVRSTQKVGRNDACPCGSGKKFKHC